MKGTLTAVILMASTPVLAAADVSGTWRTDPSSKGGYSDIKFYDCGSSVCAKMVKAFRKTGKENPDFPGVGKTLIKNMKSSDGKLYSGGTVRNPENGKNYNSKMKITGKRMKVSGCVAGGLICKSFWLTKK